MGSLIHLAIGNFEIDWGKNNNFVMHGGLFTPADIGTVHDTYVGDDEEVFTEAHEGTSAALREVLPRLELLGFTLAAAKHEYETVAGLAGSVALPIEFDELADALRKLDVDAAAVDYKSDYDFGEFFAREIFDRLKLRSLSPNDYHTRYNLGQVMENFHPYAVLRLLAENPQNLDRQVSWHFYDVVQGGWVDRDDVITDLGQVRRFLIVTEGSSDARIIGHALKLLRPEVAHFFRFVDMEEGYPFTGTGNLHRFCQGLVSIGIENNVAVVYDNDAEGCARFVDTRRLRLPSNMRVMRLPDHPSLSRICTVGPTGEAFDDVNGKAAAIECYLDLSFGETQQPCIRWTSFNSAAGVYQGELIDKERYARRFLKMAELPSDYNCERLSEVLDELIASCVSIAERRWLGSPEGLRPVTDRNL